MMPWSDLKTRLVHLERQSIDQGRRERIAMASKPAAGRSGHFDRPVVSIAGEQ